MNKYIGRVLFLTVILIVILLVALGTIPEPISKYSTAIFASNGQLLNARLAEDEQWRFQPQLNLPSKYETALLLFEDQYFHLHPGVNPVSLSKALIQNLRAGKVIRGGSTITMQNIRLRRSQHKARTIVSKLLEIYWAIALDVKWTKKQILLDYTARAPFGSNIVGLDAACWRYFEKPSNLITWAEAACLAVLPNSPSLLNPGKNRNRLLVKRNQLLYKLHEARKIDSMTLNLALLEELPEKPKRLPNKAPHMMNHLIQYHQVNGNFYSSIDLNYQDQINEVANMHYKAFASSQIFNLAILLTETSTGKVMAYVGNPSLSNHSSHVDHIQAPRSTGSILKPFLYAGALDQSKILPSTLLQDVPIVIEGFQPKNFSQTFSGMIPADDALIQSLNIPFVLLLKEYGVEQFHHDLLRLGLKKLNKPPSHYGLSLILGGGESSLWDLVGAYAYLGRTLTRYATLNNQYDLSDLHALKLSAKSETTYTQKIQSEPILYSAASIFTTVEVMKNLKRPDDLGQWKSFTSNQSIAWKTGTSYGFRDAWAIGMNAQYTIGVWVGNSSGEARPSLLGIRTAAPILFDVLSRLPSTSDKNWFDPPLDELIPMVICHASGMKASQWCPMTDTIMHTRYKDLTLPCSFHKSIFISKISGFQMNQSCTISDEIQSKIIFNLSPLQEYFYAMHHPEYEKLPALDPRCAGQLNDNNMHMIHPEPYSLIYIPKDQNGNPGKIVFKLVHRQPETPVFWHLDDQYIGTTKTFHELAVNTTTGMHTLTIVDSLGTELMCPFKILPRYK